MPGRDDLFGRGLLLEVKLEDWVNLVIGWQALIIKLSGREFRARSFFNNLARDDFALSIVVARQGIDFGLQQVAQNREAAVRVAVERAVAERELGFVAGRKQQAAFLVRDG